MSHRPLIYTRRSRGGQLFDIGLTVLGWLFFMTLFTSGMMTLLRTEPGAPHELVATPLWVSATHTLLVYALLASINAVVLIGWAEYNHRQFSGKQRRRHTQPLSGQRLQASFELSPEVLERARDAHVMVIAHEQDSTEIREINIFAQGGISPSLREAARPHHQWPGAPPALAGTPPRHAAPVRVGTAGRHAPSWHWGWQPQSVLPVTHHRTTSPHLHTTDPAARAPAAAQ